MEIIEIQLKIIDSRKYEDMKLEQSYVYVTTKRLIKSNLRCQKRIPNTSTGLFGPPHLLQYPKIQCAAEHDLLQVYQFDRFA